MEDCKEAEVINQEVHLMVDLETLDTADTALILQVGIVVFNQEEYLEEISMDLGWHHQIVAGRTVSPETMAWHKKQETDLNKFYSATGSMWVLKATMESLSKAYDLKGVWSRGSYDANVLKNADCFPFPYYRERDCRTLDVLEKMVNKNSHDALEDCKNQIEHVRSVLWNVRAVTV